MAETPAKVHYDLKNVYIFPMTKDGGAPEWGEGKRLNGAISMDLSAEGEKVVLRADGINYYQTYSNNGYDGDLNVAMVPDWFRQDILGETLSTKDKVLVENANNEPVAFAMAFEFLYDKHKRRHVLYNCVSSRPSITGENKDNQKEADTETLSLTCSPLENGNVKASTTEDTPEAVYAAWNTAPWVNDSN